MVYIICGLLFILFTVAFCYWNNNHITVTRYSLDFQEGEKVRILQLSDLHGKQFGNNNCRLRKIVEEQQPDFIAYTGDLIDDDACNVEETVDFCGRLTELCPVVYIYGNHEHRARLADSISEKLREYGVIVLDNSVTELNIKGRHISILGMNEGQATDKKLYKERRKGNYVYPDNSHYFKDFEKYSGTKLVMSHFPENFDSKDGYCYKQYPFDLQLSGHAHGGQFRLPIIGGVYSPGQGINPRFYQGLHGNGPYMVVSRGLGNSSFPLRLFNCPEVVIIEI